MINKSRLVLIFISFCFGLAGQSNSLFEQAVTCIKKYEGWHSGSDYAGYGHKTMPGEDFSGGLTESEGDSLLRIDLLQKCSVFRSFGRDSLLLGVLAYNVGEYTLLGTASRKKSKLIEKLENGDRDIYKEYISYRKYKGVIVASLERRRKEEFELLYTEE